VEKTEVTCVKFFPDVAPKIMKIGQCFTKLFKK